MKKKNLIIVLTIIFMLVLIPIPLKLKDGGSTEYKALLYSITRIHRINYQSLTGYEDGWKIELLGIQIYNKTVYIEELKTGNYELIFDLKTCLNCYKKIYEFEDGTKIYILEPFIDRQKYAGAKFSLVHTSLYFTCMANGCSKMYSFKDMGIFVKEAGLKINAVYDALGAHDYTLLECVKNDG